MGLSKGKKLVLADVYTVIRAIGESTSSDKTEKKGISNL